MKYSKLILFLFILVNNQNLFSQEKDSSEVNLNINSQLEKYVPRSVFTITGDAGVVGELYSTSRDVSRRPNSTGRIFLRPTFTFFNNFSISFDLFASTEGSDARQQINRFALHPEWSWGKAHIGDFNHKFSNYSLNGINIRGGGIEINPGLFRLQMFGGETQKAIETDPYSSIYQRIMGAVKIGIGKKDASYFDINFLYSIDDTSSLSKEKFIKDQSSENLNPQIGVTPKENLLVGVNTDLKIIKNILRFRGEAAASIFSNDIYADEEKIDEAPDFLTDIFTLRRSTNIDYSYEGILDFKYDFLNSSFKYEVINPGFRSLGMTSIMNDKKKYGINLGFKFFKNKLIIKTNFNSQNDNLLNQKKFTLKRQTYGFNIMGRPVNSLSIMFNIMNNETSNNSKNDTLKIDNNILTFMSNLSYQFNAFHLTNLAMIGFSQQLSTTYSMQSNNDNEVIVRNLFGNLNTTINRTWSFSPGFTAIFMNLWNGERNETFTYNFKLNARFFNSMWNNSLGCSMANSEYTSVLQLNYMSVLKITDSDIVKIKVRYSLTDYKHRAENNFWENVVSLGYTHRL
jgi:hypothetical protein